MDGRPSNELAATNATPCGGEGRPCGGQRAAHDVATFGGVAVRRGPAKPSVDDAPLAGRRIVVVDDDEDARDLLAAVLVRRGATVIVTSSAAGAFDAVRREHPDVLVSDIAMPEEDGLSLVRRLRALDARDGGRTPSVAVTAYASASDRRRALDAGFDAWLSKPYDHDRLVRVLLQLAPG